MRRHQSCESCDYFPDCYEHRSAHLQTELWVDVRTVSIAPNAVNMGVHDSSQTREWADVRVVTIAVTAANTVNISPQTEVSSQDM